MTDNDIITALECCQTDTCDGCPFGMHDCREGLPRIALDLINRQKAEIENLTKVAEKQQSLSMDRYFEIKRLKEENDQLKHKYDLAVAEREANVKGFTEQIERLSHRCDDCAGCTQQICDCAISKAEAVKEFAETVKVNQRTLFNYIYSRDWFVEIIDKLVKEFTEGG